MEKENDEYKDILMHLTELSKPLHDFLKNYYNPHCSIIINYDGVKIVKDILYAPDER